MEARNDKPISVNGIVPLGNIGGGLSVGYACLCVAFWANAMGFCTPGGFTISIGVVLCGFFVIYLIGALYFLKQGNTIAGAIFLTFSAVFGLFGGAMNLTGTICGVLGVPFDFTIANIAFVLAGMFLLFIVPAMKGFSKVDVLIYVFSGIGVTCFGLAGLGAAAELTNIIGGWSIFVAGVLAYYGAIAIALGASGISLPCGKPFIK